LVEGGKRPASSRGISQAEAVKDRNLNPLQLPITEIKCISGKEV